MSVWSQLRSYFSWPTEALLVGPNPSSSRKWAAWAFSFVFGLGLGLASCQVTGRAVFTSGPTDNPFSIVVLTTAVLFIPLVCVGFVLPRVGGPLLVLGALGVALSSLPAVRFNIASALGVILTIAGPMCLIGLGFTWSGLKPHTANQVGVSR
jgi:hypothetical protein